ncbi:MAG TPA: DUF2089 domain-containing protein [Acholeplasmataceae bacterium]|jgi:hypothetical protein|nr:DUF2089 domain-containing protein [Acholeplasmataceae bacterium]
MKKEVISICPVCGSNLTITKLHCHRCGIEISGDFALPAINKLSREQLTFVLMFLKNQGNIKAVEKEMNISYPTVKKILNEVLTTLGFDINEDAASGQRQEILDRLARREISFEEANELLKNLK